MTTALDKLRHATTFRLSIRRKLVLVSLSLLIIPWVGYQYINEMEDYLRNRQELQLLERARVVASLLADQPDLFLTKATTTQENSGKHLYVRPLSSPIQIDGHTGDWSGYQERVYHFSDAQDGTNPSAKSSLSFRFQIGSYKPFLYALFRVTDNKFILRSKTGSRIDNGDHLQIAMQNASGEYVRYILSARQQGKLTAYRLPTDLETDQGVEEDPRIVGYIRKTGDGYNIELKIPLSMLGAKLAFAVADVDDTRQRKIVNIVRTTGTGLIEKIGTIVVPSVQIQSLLTRLHRPGFRIWITDKTGRVIALSGSLKDTNNDVYDLAEPTESDTGVFTALMHAVYRSLLTQPTKEFHDDLSTASQLNTPEVEQALSGKPATRWRNTPDERVNILTAAFPVNDGESVVGSVAIEETSNSILILQNRAVEILINLSLLALLVTAFTVFAYATRLSFRVRKLRDSADQAIGSDGRVMGTIKASKASDEVGDLSRSMSDMVNRLAEYNRYLETMASKLSHELRTPITVVRSSLENLESVDEEHQEYTRRAKDGVERLSNILTRMSEATRLEQTIQTEEKLLFNIEQVINSCVNGYKVAHRKQVFVLQLENKVEKPFVMNGVPDLMAQLLDKLVSNAMDFAKPDTPVVIRLIRTENQIGLQVINEGPTLPETMQSNLFDSMVSMREKRGKQPHLGLGLYIVRLITEYHQGTVKAQNKSDNKGVVFTVTLPAA
ncbi:MAG: proteobacterial dedicated sortase system histidine kinase [Gammaproteobacteria bacterium]|jgi:dedicated sortase system histidine kinase